MNNQTHELISIYLQNKIKHGKLLIINTNTLEITEGVTKSGRYFNGILLIDSYDRLILSKSEFEYNTHLPIISKFINLINVNYDFAATLNNYIELSGTPA